MPSYLEIKHTYSSQRTSNLNFTFKAPASPFFCSMRGLATTADTNPYCLLHNLVNGSGLNQVPGYMEICNKGLCPSVGSATCNKDYKFSDVCVPHFLISLGFFLRHYLKMIIVQ
ncbi:hypothetical protein AMECASPLE_007586 [Ameca splendens]|uniref:Uncharacterized protein n=1 Tax=Ameca splendens TaxID=208324 RepID=A0ABV0YXN6_9TELE